MQNVDKYIPSHLIIQSLANSYHQCAKKVVNILLATYCLSGCDSVSYPFRKGKRKVLKVTLSQLVNVMDLVLFGTQNANKEYEITENIWNSCRYFFKCLYGRPNFMGDMDELRAHLFPACKTDIR